MAKVVDRNASALDVLQMSRDHLLDSATRQLAIFGLARQQERHYWHCWDGNIPALRLGKPGSTGQPRTGACSLEISRCKELVLRSGERLHCRRDGLLDCIP